MDITQLNSVLSHLKQGKTISQAEAIALCDCYRLSAVIDRLRKQGFNILTHNEANLNGKGTHARYELKEFEA
ncbi:helix-turn-helix domain-containing protein [Acinetobacter sp.]|uniref:helix-turn-helix domain-containing protein n=1 Tax=Acinetobacter sp. TaxID=472 RepID=UPI0031E17EDF